MYMLWTLVIVTLVIVPLVLMKKHQKVFDSFKQVMQGISLRHVLYGLLSVAGTCILIVLLLQIHVLQYGGYYFIQEALNNSTSSSSVESFDSTPLFSYQKIFPLLTVAILFVLIPYLAYSEEEMFREELYIAPLGKKIAGSFKFGMIHLVMFIPIAAGIALTFAGLVFLFAGQAYYRKAYQARKKELLAVSQAHEEAVGGSNLSFTEGTIESLSYYYGINEALMESARVHAVHNYIILTLLSLSIIFL